MIPKTSPREAPHFLSQNGRFGGPKWTPKSQQIVKTWVKVWKSCSWAPASKIRFYRKNENFKKAPNKKKGRFQRVTTGSEEQASR